MGVVTSQLNVWLEMFVLASCQTHLERLHDSKKPLRPHVSWNLQLNQGENADSATFLFEGSLAVVQDRRPTKKDPSDHVVIATIETVHTGYFLTNKVEITDELRAQPPLQFTLPLVLAYRDILADLTRWMGLPEFPRSRDTLIEVSPSMEDEADGQYLKSHPATTLDPWP